MATYAKGNSSSDGRATRNPAYSGNEETPGEGTEKFSYSEFEEKVRYRRFTIAQPIESTMSRPTSKTECCR